MPPDARPRPAPLRYPRADGVLLGGTYAEGDWDTAPRPAETAAILRRCARYFPELADPALQILRVQVGLRPGRTAVRCERGADVEAEVSGRVVRVPVVHNVGHGGNGWTVHWGCAGDATDLALAALGRPRGPKL